MVAHALFSDAAAAVVLVPGDRGVGPAVVEIASLTDTTTADHMTWHVTDLGFRMGLSPRVPDVLSHHVGPLVAGLLDRHGRTASDVAGWAVHPGGPRILDVVERAARPRPAAIWPRPGPALAEHGNCSSPTVLMILERLLQEPPVASGPMVLMAFGPGLTLFAGLLLP